MKKTLGGDRLGSGKRMQVELHGYERSTHDLGYIWRSTMSAGTLVPFCNIIGLPGDTFDIHLDADVKTHPTIGPLFGSYKLQADVFIAPLRLYQGKLHNNALNIGMKMSDIKLPLVTLYATEEEFPAPDDIDNSQINPSCILAYLGIRGVGYNAPGSGAIRARNFNAIDWLAYWEIYKNYYANKQEEIGAVIHTPRVPLVPLALLGFQIGGNAVNPWPTTNIPSLTSSNGTVWNLTGATNLPILSQIKVRLNGVWTFLNEIPELFWIPVTALDWTATWQGPSKDIDSWDYIKASEIEPVPPEVTTFPLTNIDEARERTLANAITPGAMIVNASIPLPPYSYIALGAPPASPIDLPYLSSQEGLGLKTYQSDLFNNWLQTDWIDGVDGITAITSIDTSGGSFSIDTLNLSKKVYDMLNRIAVSGGSYDDWIDAVYTHDRYTRVESPVYVGGLIKELIFQEVVSNSSVETTEDGNQPLGTLAGKGVMARKHKGGSVYIKVDEPSIIIGIISLTPRIDYSQGNKWHTHLTTMDDFHKPALDQIGFQELITEQMAWWTTAWDTGVWVTKSAGKQPAWINYMTDINRTYGNFAIASNEMFMTLNRRYERGTLLDPNAIKDLTTYIDPSKYNFIFAQTSLDAQNFWTQMSVDITGRRKMSAKIMPNL